MFKPVTTSLDMLAMPAQVRVRGGESGAAATMMDFFRGRVRCAETQADYFA
jgi:hypothetical protein